MRRKMVETQIRLRGVESAQVLQAMEKVPRHLFVPLKMRDIAYSDNPLPIGCDQTISQPYIVAFMTELLDLKSTDKILEVGTGSGYQSAVLAEIAHEVYSVEILPSLYENARKTLSDLGYQNIFLKLGDGTKGWPEHAPYDKIIVTAAAHNAIPPFLIDQLKEGGIIVIPVGSHEQELVSATKGGHALKVQHTLPVRFVPLIQKNE